MKKINGWAGSKWFGARAIEPISSNHYLNHIVLLLPTVFFFFSFCYIFFYISIQDEIKHLQPILFRRTYYLYAEKYLVKLYRPAIRNSSYLISNHTSTYFRWTELILLSCRPALNKSSYKIIIHKEKFQSKERTALAKAWIYGKGKLFIHFTLHVFNIVSNLAL